MGTYMGRNSGNEYGQGITPAKLINGLLINWSRVTTLRVPQTSDKIGYLSGSKNKAAPGAALL